MSYDFSVLANTTGIVPILQAANTFTVGLFGIFLLVIVFAIVFFPMKVYNNARQSLAVSFFAVFIVGLFLRLLQIIENKVFGGCVILLIGAVVMIINKD